MLTPPKLNYLPFNSNYQAKTKEPYMQLTEPINKIKGIGDKTAKTFQRLGIETVGQLISHFPRGYESYDPPVAICAITEGDVVAIQASVHSRVDMRKSGNLTILSCRVQDPTGTMYLTWFNQPYLKNMLYVGYRFIFRGKAVIKNGTLVLEQPKIYKKEEYRKYMGVLQPIYPLTEGLTNNMVSKGVKQALEMLEYDDEYLPRRIVKAYGLIRRRDALTEIHFPKSNRTMMTARERLVFDEFFGFTYMVSRLKENVEEQVNPYYGTMEDKPDCDRLIGGLPYRLTNAQQNVWGEIKGDILGRKTMNRLIQGDVGSGKTILAVLALMLVAKNGYQGCIMVPTEVLAAQHFEVLRKLLLPFDIKVELLVGSMTATQKRQAYERISLHMADVIVGTHALIQEGVAYDGLALVITDEQHRFGVRQRDMLAHKGDMPHVLVMSATPIPRTLAIILYGDLDISIIDELPANRLPIKTCVVDTGYRPTAYKFIKKEVEMGRQAYIICPMVDESENMEAENVIDYAQRLKEALGENILDSEVQNRNKNENALDNTITIEYIHGKMKPAAKNDIMERFASGGIDVLVSTTVIEVGVDVPNATVMMVEDAQHFGLAQLHQLRGRVGRSGHQSYCILVCGNRTKETMERLEVMNRSNDGFYIAGEDLKLRGPGDFFGIRQSGDMEFALGDIYNDANILKNAHESLKSLTLEEKAKIDGILSFNSVNVVV